MTTKTEPHRSLWAYVPAFLLLSMLSGLGVLASIAIDDPSFSVEKDYYQKAVLWDRELEQRRQNDALGWHTALRLARLEDGRTEVGAVLRDRNQTTIGDADVVLEAFSNVRAAERVNLRLEADGAGVYRGVFSPTRGGLWEFRLRAVRGAEQYTEVVRQDLPRRSAQ